MTDAYTVFWPQDRCLAATSAVGAGLPLQVLFGGPHLSLPSFVRAKVRAGDLVYPIGVHGQKLYVLGRMRVTEVLAFGGEDRAGLHRQLDRFPQWRFLTGSCMNEVVLGENGTRLRLDAAMPPEALQRLTYRSQRATRTVKHVSADGRLTRSLGVQGIYRLGDQCSADLDAVLAQPTTRTGSVFGRQIRTPTTTPAQTDALFWQSFRET
ncbi:hypothetical protein ACSNN7_08230 [Micromonospora sp. URMC 105]|uniref:hypothetical protein n=1 Tax=Micromonospora sp. URMC 105 TaxID=3423413 RepID=UPI003F1B77F5